MSTAPDLTMSTMIAATDQTKAAAAPRIKLLSHGFSIDHQTLKSANNSWQTHWGSPIAKRCMASSGNW